MSAKLTPNDAYTQKLTEFKQQSSVEGFLSLLRARREMVKEQAVSAGMTVDRRQAFAGAAQDLADFIQDLERDPKGST